MFKKRDRESPMDGMVAFLGKGLEFSGVVTYFGTIRIDGKIEGEIITEGVLIVGESAEIHADIQAGIVISGGHIFGNIRARQKVHLLTHAVMQGVIQTPTLIIEEGVTFNGKCDMSPIQEEEGARPLRAIGAERV